MVVGGSTAGGCGGRRRNGYVVQGQALRVSAITGGAVGRTLSVQTRAKNRSLVDSDVEQYIVFLQLYSGYYVHGSALAPDRHRESEHCSTTTGPLGFT